MFADNHCYVKPPTGDNLRDPVQSWAILRPFFFELVEDLEKKKDAEDFYLAEGEKLETNPDGSKFIWRHMFFIPINKGIEHF